MKTKFLTPILVFCTIFFTQCSKQSNDYPIRPVQFTDVQIEDEFWLPRLKINREVTIPYALKMCEETGRIDNFAIAGGLIAGLHKGYYFNDSDLFKVIEGASYSLAIFPDPELEKYLDEIIAKIAAAQEDDGYLYTARTAQRADKLPPGGEQRWSNIADGHELYNAGHLYEAAVAHFQATGKSNLLDIALNNAGLILEEFGPGKKHNPTGHQEIEIALGKLYRLTEDAKYLDMAKFFLDQRGDSTGHKLYGAYCQDHIPVIEQQQAVGHSVRAAYLYSGMADIAALTGNKDYINAIGKIWHNVVNKKLYITGGIGAAGGIEGFADDYVLPNGTAYSETCASIANAMWNHRMFLLHGETKYIDVLERILYNGFLSGISMDGDRFFYPNRLETIKGEQRSPWFPCACCPSNVVRFLPSIPGYIYANRQDQIYVNLFIGSTTTIEVNHQPVTITQKTQYPWEGTSSISVSNLDKPQFFTINIRIPGWAQNKPLPGDLYHYLNTQAEDVTVLINNQTVKYEVKNGYAQIRRSWNNEDRIDIKMPMTIRRVAAHDSVEADRGRITLERGPLVYCLEWPDIKGGDIKNLLLPDDEQLQTKFNRELLNGVQIITGKIYRIKDSNGTAKPQNFTAIPYYAWAHRGQGEMSVWIAREESAVGK